ncbi:DUF3343 domain-containing protein [Oscillospiraceae bacterium OttesenSCG-928-F05]|nr:DUF3343 domain-containing protein [Oscillospiraceae bacterium OttesenSCG-928-F05]
MANCYIMSRSLTNAQRSVRVLQHYGILSHMVRPPQHLTGRGCGYAVRIHERDLGNALRLLDDNGLPAKKVHRVGADGSYTEVKV